MKSIKGKQAVYSFLSVIFIVGLLFSYSCAEPEPVAPAPAVPPVTPIPAPVPEPSVPSNGNIMVEVPQIVVPDSVNEGKIGLAVGGAKDINNFRENIENNYLPLPTDITYEGLFYDYYFDTGQSEECQKLFCPSYSYAVSRDPLSGEEEYYLSVGLNSGMKERDFARKKLNLVIVMDVSGSMGHPFDSYYYDQFGKEVKLSWWDSGKEKIEVARESVVSLFDQLNDDDYLGIVLFNDEARLAKPLNPVGETDIRAIADHVMDITADSGTNLAAGMEMAVDLFDTLPYQDASEYENRIIFLTDAMPNTGEIREYGLMDMAMDASERKIYTSFIGVGVDFNTELVEYITKIRGANYYSVHSPEQFRERLDDEFEYMVTPLVFDLRLTLETHGWEIEKVYGSPEADESTGELMRVNTLFPSKREGGETKGGLILLKLRKTSSWDDDLVLRTSYEDRYGNKDYSEAYIDLDEIPAESFENSGIRKGVLLARYADLLKNWTMDEREHVQYSSPWEPRVDDWVGIEVPPPTHLGQWERQSLPLVVSSPYREVFDEFRDYFKQEMNAIGDSSLKQELEILDKLRNYDD